MLTHLRRLIAAGALGVALLVVALGSAVSVSADISPVTFQKLGCANGDLACYQARLNGSVPLTTPYCDGSGCTSVPVGDSVLIPVSSTGVSTGIAPSDIDPLTYQKLGCTNGDLNCYYARLNGSVPITTPYCNGTTCTSVPVGDSTIIPVSAPIDPATVSVPQPAQGGIMPALNYR
jgi:hypothetical protein